MSPALVAARAMLMASAGRKFTAADLAEVSGCSLLKAQRTLRGLHQAGYLFGTRARPTKAGSNPILWRRS